MSHGESFSKMEQPEVVCAKSDFAFCSSKGEYWEAFNWAQGTRASPDWSLHAPIHSHVPSSRSFHLPISATGQNTPASPAGNEVSCKESDCLGKDRNAVAIRGKPFTDKISSPISLTIIKYHMIGSQSGSTTHMESASRVAHARMYGVLSTIDSFGIDWHHRMCSMETFGTSLLIC